MSDRNNIQAVKIRVIPFFIFLITLFSSSLKSQEKPKANKKLFLYASELPKTMSTQYYQLRKHVVDVVLATQKYDLMFSTIPDRLVKSTVPQMILKYKIRTQSPRTLKLELLYIDADQVSIKKHTVFEHLPKTNFEYLFRLHLYEFILNKKLLKAQRQEFKKLSIKRILSFAKANRMTKERRKKPEINHHQELQKKQNTQKQKKIKASSPNKNNKEIKSKNQKPSLWELLRDNDRDSTWQTKSPIAINEKLEKKYLSKKLLFEEKIISKATPLPSINPFLNIGSIGLKSEDDFSQSLSTSQFHFGLKFVQRELVVKDIIQLTNTFTSIIGATFEWIIFQPIHISRTFLRAGFEIDKALKTSPIKMNDHFLFRMGAGYRLAHRLLPSIYYERSSLVYANLNNISEGLVSNVKTLNWINLELAYLGIKQYVSVHFAKSIYTSGVKDIREVTLPNGYRFGFNYRYFFKNKLFKLKWWGDVEYRNVFLTGQNINNTIEITKKEYSFRVGIHF